MRKSRLVTSLIVVLVMALARPAMADVIATFDMTETSPIGGGNFTINMTTNQILSSSLEFIPPGESPQAASLGSYTPCGPTCNLIGALGADQLIFMLSGGGHFVAWTAYPLIDFVAGTIPFDGTMNDYFCTTTINPSCVVPPETSSNLYGGQLYIVNEAIPEPSSAVLFVSALALLFLVTRRDSARRIPSLRSDSWTRIFAFNRGDNSRSLA